MTDLERKLAETLREQGGEVTPDLAGAWAEQLRRQRRPRAARRRLTVLVAPLAAVLVVLTSVLLATQLNSAPTPVQPARPGRPFVLAKPEHRPLSELQVTGTPAILTNFVGQTDVWTTYVFTATVAGAARFCVAAVPRGDQLVPGAPQYGTKSPSCVPLDDKTELAAGYVGENGGPLPADKAVFVTATTVLQLRTFNAKGDLSAALQKTVSDHGVFLVDVVEGSPPERYEADYSLTSQEAHPASR
ncbi:hypothetical protein [Amycolatopsis sp. WQ 127309]|uniref:hypothetical protein n=1 Tax=Amycolatopsis sp. WQ 127309 TaxID=2932773 RepID=UPI001FF338FF|nr:hypothetical protein [Amycolatopsis sp. WQ 127309]UOZ08926.1 hypothetical protein MUY22_11870 [Amycolatopsis sp. WQ 127309]